MDIKSKLIIIAVALTFIGLGSIIISVIFENFWLALTIGGGVAFVDACIAEAYTKIY